MKDIMLYPLNQLKSYYEKSYLIHSFTKYINIYKDLSSKMAETFIIYRTINMILPNEISMLIISFKISNNSYLHLQ